MKTVRQPVYGPLAGLSATSEQFGVMEVTYLNKPQSMCTAAAFTQVTRVTVNFMKRSEFHENHW